MTKKKNMPLLSELNLTDRFLFDEVMEDPQTHQDVLSIIFGKEISLLTQNETEKEFRLAPSARSIRLDVFAKDEEQNVYNTEMQLRKKQDLVKRSRYYQSMVDVSLLDAGIPDYNKLNTSYIIMIMPFDLFGYGRYMYSFRAVCEQEPGCVLEDGANRIFLNTRGQNDHEVSQELIDFLHYVENTTDEAAQQSCSEKIRRIHKRVSKVRSSEEVGVKYMQAWEEKYYERQEGREEGYAEGWQAGEESGRQAGEAEKLKNLIARKLEKGLTVEEIAELFEEELDTVRRLADELQAQKDEVQNSQTKAPFAEIEE